MEDVGVDPERPGLSFAKRLASCDESIRNRASRNLRSWLQSQEDVSEEEMKRIWKGLFYCFWHADKQAFQAELAGRLASPVSVLAIPLACRYLEVFLLTIRREWSGIDFLRLDKFYLLIRRFLCAFFALLKKNLWDPEVLRRMMTLLVEKSLLSNDDFTAGGVNYQIAEVFLQELKGFLPIGADAAEGLLRPFAQVAARTPDKVLLKKIKSGVFDFLSNSASSLLKAKQSMEVVDANEDVDKFGSIGLKLRISKWLLESASSEGTVQSNRKTLFDLHGAFSKLEKVAEALELEIGTLPEENAIRTCESDIGCEIGGNGILENDVVDNDSGVRRQGSEVDALVDSSNAFLDTDEKASSAVETSKKKKDKKVKKSKSTKKHKLPASSGSEAITIEETKDSSRLVSDADGVSGSGGVILSSEDSEGVFCSVQLDKAVISNLQQQFEKVAAEAGMSLENSTLLDTHDPQRMKGVSEKRKRQKVVGYSEEQTSSPGSLVGNVSKKRRTKNGTDDANLGPVSPVVNTSATKKSGEKSTKKVRFAMKNNLVWNSNSPLPPQSLRVPPSATPRGSALKKGVPPGPIRVMRESPKAKKVKQRGSLIRKSRKGPKSVSPAVKRIWKL